jgi:hypothetical protein
VTLRSVKLARTPAVRLLHHDALERLLAFLVAFDDLDVQTHRVADFEATTVVTLLFRLEGVDDVHPALLHCELDLSGRSPPDAACGDGAAGFLRREVGAPVPSSRRFLFAPPSVDAGMVTGDENLRNLQAAILDRGACST